MAATAGPSHEVGGQPQQNERYSSSPSSSPIASSSRNGADQSQFAQKGKRRLENSGRPKNLQACDRCRQKKIKCLPITLIRDTCQSCSTASISCTFDLPITVSRTKRIKKGFAGRTDPSMDNGTGGQATPSEEPDSNVDPIVGEHAGIRSPRRLTGLRRSEPSSLTSGTAPTIPASVRREGPTALSYILHSTPTLPLSFLSTYDQENGMTMYPSPPGSGDGFMLITTPNASHVDSPGVPVVQALTSDSWAEVVSRLVETFLVHVSPMIPIVSRGDVNDGSPLLIHAIAGVAAARRNCPKEIFETLRYLIRKEMVEQDILSNPNRQNVQILLILSLVDELAMQPGTAVPTNIARTRLASAIRMAQDLAMDLALPKSAEGSADARIWRCAIVIDQWNAARNGMRPIIPVSRAVLHPEKSPALPQPKPSKYRPESNDFFDGLVGLSQILGRTLVSIYGPNGVKQASNEDLVKIADDLGNWKDGLPDRLQDTGSWSSLPAGLLHMLYTAVLILIYRPFMRWSFICPSTISLNVDIPVWQDIMAASRTVIEWSANQEELADLFFFGPYALGLCGLVQYHTWARRKEWDGVLMLDKLRRGVMERWTARLPDGHLTMQRAQLEVIPLLYAASQNPRMQSFEGKRGLNPTPGILNKLPETSITGVTFLRDATHPRGGVLVATQQAAREIKDLPPGTVIIGGPPEEDLPTNPARPQTVNDNNMISYSQNPPLGDSTSGSTNVAIDTYLHPPLNGVQNGVNDNFFNNLGMSQGDVSGSQVLAGALSTPDWEACVSSFVFPNFDGMVTDGL